MNKYLYIIYDEADKSLIASTLGDNRNAVMDLVKNKYGWTGLNASKGPATPVDKKVKTGYVYGRSGKKEYKKIPYVRIRANDVKKYIFI